MSRSWMARVLRRSSNGWAARWAISRLVKVSMGMLDEGGYLGISSRK